MTDRELATARQQATELERAARAQWEAQIGDDGERTAALAVMRLVIPLRRMLETWITERACRAAVQS